MRGYHLLLDTHGGKQDDQTSSNGLRHAAPETTRVETFIRDTREALRVYNGPDRDAKLIALLDAACEGACVACRQLFREFIRSYGGSMEDCPVGQD